MPTQTIDQPSPETRGLRSALILAGVGGLALAAAAVLLWLRYGGEVFTAALQSAWTCF